MEKRIRRINSCTVSKEVALLYKAASREGPNGPLKADGET